MQSFYDPVILDLLRVDSSLPNIIFKRSARVVCSSYPRRLQPIRNGNPELSSTRRFRDIKEI